MGLTRLAINFAVKNQKIESFNNFLFVGPHPDDIEIGAGATIAKLVKLGKKVTFLICSDGRYGKENLSQDVSSEQLIEIRKNECLESAKILGVSNLIFLNLCDGNQYSKKELFEGIAKTINEVKPDIIFAPDPDVISECHIDHLNVGRAVKELGFFANFPEIFTTYLPDGISSENDINVQAIALYFTNKPNKYVRIAGFFKKQLESIYAHKSQFPQNSEARKSIVTYLKIRSFEYGFKRFSGRADAFRMMNRTRMHCLPEASK